MRMPYKEWNKLSNNYDYLQINEFIRINHNNSNCSGDSKSMKIWRNDKGILKARCFRCGEWGSGDVPEHARVLAHTSFKPACISKSIFLPADTTPALGVKQKVWLNKYALTADEIAENGIAYSPSRDSLILPIYGTTSSLIGYQERHWKPEFPKYTTKVWDKRQMWWHNESDTEPIVIVEDVISGIKVGRHAACIALLGTFLSDDALTYAGKFSKALVWLDYDNKTVKLNANKIANRVSTLVQDVSVIHSKCDPKEIDDASIQAIITSS